MVSRRYVGYDVVTTLDGVRRAWRAATVPRPHSVVPCTGRIRHEARRLPVAREVHLVARLQRTLHPDTLLARWIVLPVFIGSRLLRCGMPFKSQAQRRKFAQLLVEGKISPDTYEEWNRETGATKLPERVTRTKTAAKRTTARKRQAAKKS
jgi:hypothetical protein